MTQSHLTIYFFLLFLGDLKNEGSVLEWLLSSDNRELDDAIEAVNEKMLSKLLQTTPFMAVFFCKFFFNFYTKNKIESTPILKLAMSKDYKPKNSSKNSSKKSSKNSSKKSSKKSS